MPAQKAARAGNIYVERQLWKSATGKKAGGYGQPAAKTERLVSV